MVSGKFIIKVIKDVTKEDGAQMVREGRLIGKVQCEVPIVDATACFKYYPHHLLMVDEWNAPVLYHHYT